MLTARLTAELQPISLAFLLLLTPLPCLPLEILTNSSLLVSNRSFLRCGALAPANLALDTSV